MKAKNTAEDDTSALDLKKSAEISSAAQLFWEKGYDGTTVDELIAAMGISKTTFNDVYGNKQLLFKLVLDKFKENTSNFLTEPLAQPKLQSVIKILLHQVVDFLASPGNAKRCLFLEGTSAWAEDSEPIRKELLEWRRQIEADLLKRIVKAQADLDLPDAISPDELTRFLATLITGMAVHAANGASKSDLKQTVDLSIRLMRGVIFDISE